MSKKIKQRSSQQTSVLPLEYIALFFFIKNDDHGRVQVRDSG
jgi:hypothetical protein